MPDNPLLDFTGLPRFNEIQPAHVTPAIDHLLADSRAEVDRLTQSGETPNWDNFVQPLEDSLERLGRAWSQVSHLNAVVNTPELREAYNANLPGLTAFYADLSQNEALFARYRLLRRSPGFEQLSAAQQKIVENELRDFRLGGAELGETEKARFKAVQEESATLAARFEENVLDATNAFSKHITDAKQLAGLPDDIIAAAREAAAADGQEGWKFSLHAPSWLPVMQYADDRTLREEMYHAYVTRASEFGPPTWDNSSVMQQILWLRLEAARLLGFENYARLSVETKMAETPDEVLTFLTELAERARPYAERDLAELQTFAASRLNLPELKAWDIAYASEKLRVARYAFSDQEVKTYFPEPKVLAGMFRVVETLYGLTITQAEAPAWHPDVKFFDVTDRQGVRVAQFYLDLYARPNKRGGAWMDDAITRRRTASGVQTPVAYLTTNFAAPVGGKPALFTHDDVITLFHEFGHGLHHLLTRIEHLGVAGINGVEWDAVELPSQFMENFCWEWDVVQHLSAHVDTHAPLPRELFNKMLAARNFQAGLQTMRQLEFSLFDMELHKDFDPNRDAIYELLARVRAQVAVLHPPAYNRFPNSFSHIFAGGYAAGYYSYKWAEVLSADAYSLFEENGVLDPETGEMFWEEILAMGGARPALESFIAFRGRPPQIDALLRHSGMTGQA